MKISVPPTDASGKFHLGHVMSHVIADVFSRYYNLRTGRDLGFNEVWNAQGKPLEYRLDSNASEDAFKSLAEENISRARKIKSSISLLDSEEEYRDFDEESREFAIAVFRRLEEKDLLVMMGEQVHLDLNKVRKSIDIENAIGRLKIEPEFIRRELLKISVQLNNTYPLTKKRRFATHVTFRGSDFTLNPLFDLSLYGRILGDDSEPLFLQINGPDVLVRSSYVSLMVSLAYDGRLPFERLFVHPIIRDSEGKKISKNSREIKPVDSLLKDYGGSFALRYWALSSLKRGLTSNYDGRLLERGRVVGREFDSLRRIYLESKMVEEDMELDRNFANHFERMKPKQALILFEKTLFEIKGGMRRGYENLGELRKFRTLDKYKGVLFG